MSWKLEKIAINSDFFHALLTGMIHLGNIWLN